MPTGPDNDVLRNGHFILKIYGKYRKNGKNRAFIRFGPLNSVFGGNFTPYSQEGDIRHILGQNWKFKIFVPFRGMSLKGQKMTIFGHFEPKTQMFVPATS